MPTGWAAMDRNICFSAKYTILSERTATASTKYPSFCLCSMCCWEDTIELLLELRQNHFEESNRPIDNGISFWPINILRGRGWIEFIQ